MKKNYASALWKGSVKEGNGTITTQSQTLNNSPYSFKSRFEGSGHTHPDELFAAAHAGCFAMALSLILGQAGFTPNSLDAKAEVSMDTDKLEITGSHLTLKADIPNISQEKFVELTNAAKDNCPISKAMSVNITLDATLV